MADGDNQRQWGRACRLQVKTKTDADYEVIDFDGLRIVFYVQQAIVSKPASADIRIYNVSAETAARLRDEGDDVLLEAGYGDGLGVIFSGQTIQRFIVRENPTDTYLQIIAVSGDQAFNHGVVNKTLAAGATPDDVYQTISDAYAAHGVSPGGVPDLPATALPRGKVMYGPARDFAQTLADTHKLDWALVNGEYVCIAKKGIITSTDQAIEINVNTGMIGMPQVAIDGIYVTCLLNPRLGFRSIVKLDNSSINLGEYSADVGAQTTNILKGKGMLSADGLYKVVSCDYSGDTRGDTWFCDLVCVGINAALQPLGGASINAVDNPS